MYNHKERIEKGLKVLRELDQKTYESVSKFIEKLEANNYSKGRIYKYVYCLKTLRKLLDKDFSEASKEDIERLVITINNSDYSEASKSDFKKILKFYFRWLKFGKLEGKYPEEVEWIKTTIKKNNEKIPEQILTQQEVEAIANKSNNPMERAFVLCLYETGCRIGEFLNMRIKDINFDQYGCCILVSGKTGWRRVRVIDYAKDLVNWLDTHPFKNNVESFVWIDPKTGKRIFPDIASKILKRLTKKAGITKACNPHAFRHARATHLAKILTEQQLKVYFGWAKDSGMASVYVHLSGEDVDESLLEAKGVKIEKVQKQTNPTTRVCQNCGEVNSILSHFCKKCNFPLDFKAMFKMDKFAEFLRDFLIYYAEKDKNFKKAFVQFV
ncbi:MAG: tyrosine-type recombinase/integrase, partial [Candidatus Aenigmarchaeota archaeon]|nr:tyrosine-type recombinase/integrase [Candidatus Aenigmarchaeota archaeon]MDW8149537.1 tyrosine-type recombinase/integrase [Candidatus Aenigmarchaeota archaeon]